MPSATGFPQDNASNDLLYDVIIIGGSHAGLSAALTLFRGLHTCLIFDSGSPRNALASTTHLTSAWENKDPEKLREASKAELVASGLVQLVSRTVTTAEKTAKGSFEVTDEEEVKWRGRKILLSIGVQEIYPDIEGYGENYGSRIYYCMFCFGYEHRGCAQAGVLATGTLANAAHALTNAQDALKFAETVTIYTNANPTLATELTSKLPEGILVNDKPVKKTFRDKYGGDLGLEFEDGEEDIMAFLMHKPDLKVDQTIPDQLGVECVPGLGIKVIPPFNQTNVEGVFAAGDCCSPLRIIPNAMNSGSFAGCGLARQLPKSRHSVSEH